MGYDEQMPQYDNNNDHHLAPPADGRDFDNIDNISHHTSRRSFGPHGGQAS